MGNKGNSLWKEAKKIIPGGNTLISKRQEKFIREKWPTYYSKAKKCEIWDLSGKKFYDLSLMGVGTNILGYANSEVDNAVIKAIKKSNMSTLNCPEEVQLAKKLLKMHPWAGVVKFTRSGGEANALAIRMARAHTKKNNIAFCGYHGWHDWYLSANLSDKKNLGKFLSNNINISGVSKNLKNTSFPFKYNEFEALNKVIKKKNIGIIKMEVERNEKPKKNFLKKIRNISNKKKIILIFDECTSGFRATFGGIHKKHKVNPDMMILGKALGNGYAINAVLAKKDFLKSSESLFISSTFWGERAGYVAALKTLEIMKKKKSWKNISKIGKQIKKK
jgi:glutamate-1-semialdehyde 2,1-aminomutase